jgi:NitT/TauT family transport system permease protein
MSTLAQPADPTAAPAARAAGASDAPPRASGAAPARPGLWSIRGPMSQRRYWLFAAVGLITPLLAWWIVSNAGWVEKVFMPTPAAVWQRTVAWWTEDQLLQDMAISIYRVTAGWALSAVIALPFGLLIGTFRPVQALLEPLTDFIRYMPAVAFIPLVMLWVGIDESSKIAIIFIGTFFQMVLMVAEDVRRVPAAQIEAAQTMGATRSEIIQLVLLQSAKPALLDTMRVTMGWAWTYLVVAELVAANSGLGYAILKAQRFLQTDKIFAGIILIGLIGLITDQLFRLAHRKAFPWLHKR